MFYSFSSPPLVALTFRQQHVQRSGTPLNMLLPKNTSFGTSRRFLGFSILCLSLLTQTLGFAQLAARRNAARYVAGSSSVVVESAASRLILSPAGSTFVDLSIEKLPDTPVELCLRDENRHVLFSQRSRTDAPFYVLRLDLRELDNGTYLLAVRVGNERVTRKIRLISLSRTEQMVVLED